MLPIRSFSTSARMSAGGRMLSVVHMKRDIQMKRLIPSLSAITASALFLIGCGRSLNEFRPVQALVQDQKPVVSAAVLAEPEGKTVLPEKLSLVTGWELWGEDRDRLDACVMLSTAQRMTIEALQER